jgi:hypothetical protein
MKKNSILLIRVAKEIETELEGIEKLKREFFELPGGDASYLLRARASIFHDFYTALERIMVRIAEELNGGLPKSDQWHKELLFDMTLDLEGVRPPVFSKELRGELADFLRFRHLFRNNYGYELKTERLGELGKVFPVVAGRSLAEVRKFHAWLAGQAEL